MSSFYLNKYGANTSATTPTFLDSYHNIYTNTFVGAMLDYNKISLGSVGFLFENDTQTETDTFSSFYDTYKTIVGSDILSYTNKYSNTNAMAMGDMMNSSLGSVATYTGAGTRLSYGDGYVATTLLSADPDSFMFRATKDGDPYRYTEANTSNDLTGGYGTSLNQLTADYQFYYDCKIAQFDGKTSDIQALSPSVNLSALKINYATISAAAGGDATQIKAIYTNLVNQLTDELAAIKPGTISDQDKAAMEKTLIEKQTALKAIDDELYGYKDNTTSSTTHIYSSSYDFAAATVPASVMSVANNSTYRDKYNLSLNASNQTGPAAGNVYDGKYFSSAADITTYQAILAGTNTATVYYYSGDDSASDRKKYAVTGLTNTFNSTTAMNDLYDNTLGLVYSEELTLGARTNFDAQLATTVLGYDGAMPTAETKLTTSLSQAQGEHLLTLSTKEAMLDYLITSVDSNMSASAQINAINAAYSQKLRDSFKSALNTAIKASMTPVPKDEAITKIEPAITERIADVNRTSGIATFTMSDSDMALFKDKWKWQVGRAGHHDWDVTGWPYNDCTAYSNPLVDFQGFLDFMDPEHDGTYALDLKGESFGEALRREIASHIIHQASNASNGHVANHIVNDIKEGGIFDNYTTDGGIDFRQMKNLGDANSFVLQLAGEIKGEISDCKTRSLDPELDNDYIDGDAIKAANYIAEITAGLMEQYWIENFNKDDAEAINTYFAREFSAYFNPLGVSGDVKGAYKSDTGAYVSFNMDFNEDPAEFNIIDNIMQSQSFVQIYSKMEDRARAEMELFEATTALDIVQNVNTQEYLFRLNMLAALEKDADTNKVTLGGDDVIKEIFKPVTRTLVELGPGASKNPWWEEYFPWFKGFYGTMPEGATAEDMFDKDGNIKASMISKNGALIDPYIVKINDVDYVMGIDGNKDGKINGAQEVLGINDKIDSGFASLKALDLDADGIISQSELKEGGIIFEALNIADRLNGAQIKTDFIKAIDLASTQKADGQNGIFGTFEVQLGNGKKAGAIQTFETQEYFNNLFGTYVDMSFLSQTEAQKTVAEETKTAIQPKTEAVKTAATQFKAQTLQAKQYNFFSHLDNTEEVQEQTSNKFDIQTLQAKKYNFFSFLDNTEETTAETPVSTTTKATSLDVNKKPVIMISNKEITVDALIEDLCWKMNIDKLTAKQRYDILGSVDVTQASDIVIKKIEEKLSKTQFSA